MSEWTGRRVLVTGATGIVGSWLTRRLVDLDARVVALVCDRDPQSELLRSGTIDLVSVVDGCLEDIEAIERGISTHEIDAVFHLGAQTIVGTALRSPLVTFEANIRGTYNLLEVCRRMDGMVKAIVVASSDKAYGESKTLPYTEDLPLQGRHPYDVSKSCADLIAQAYAQTYDLPVAIARCGNVYGGGDLNWSRLVPGTIRSALRGERPVIRSNGTLTRDYIFVDDVVEAYLAVGEALDREDVRGEAYNFANGDPLTVTQMVDSVLQVMGRQDLEPIVTDVATAEIEHQSLDSTKAAKVLEWKPAWNLDAGLRRTLEWYERYLAG